MATIVKPNTFSAGALILAAEHNSNFDTIYNDYNGNITNANISASAGIVDTKLAQITTASKVSGAALSSLTSIPTDAGNIPIQSLGNVKTSSILFRIDGAGSVPSTGYAGDIEVPFACSITQTGLFADQNGAVIIDVWKDTYANYPATDADSITSQTPLTITTGTKKAQDLALTGWTKNISAGDVLRFNVDSVGTITACTISLWVNRT